MKLFLSNWILNFTGLLLILLVTVIYLLLNKNKWQRRSIYFMAALAIMVVSFFSPLHRLASGYLFSAHMVIHVLLLFVAAPLLLLSIPGNLAQKSGFAFRVKSSPLAGWIAGVGIMWFWHIPFVFNSMMSSHKSGSFSFIHFIEALTLLLAGIFFTMPILHPNRRLRISNAGGILYLFTACIGCSLLGLLITFAPAGTYHLFLSPHDAIGWNSIIQNKWRITRSVDQQIAGLIMWVPCCFLYVAASMYLLVQWLNKKETPGNLFHSISQ